MAARRITQSSVNWAAIAERVPEQQKVNFAAFKARSDTYLRSVLGNPETAPKIDWTYYKKLVPVAGLVDNFQKQYDAVKIPYPVDNVTVQVVAQEKEVRAEVTQYVKGSKDRIVQHENEISHLKSLLPYDQMTMEDYRDAFPDLALDAINRPTFWPHTPDEQLGSEPKKVPDH